MVLILIGFIVFRILKVQCDCRLLLLKYTSDIGLIISWPPKDADAHAL